MIEKIVFVSTLALTSVLVCATVDQPNIVMVVLDDVGWADFNYSIGGELSVSVIDNLVPEH